jgi:hypothetical protein
MYLLKVISKKLNLDIKIIFVGILKKPLTATSMTHAGNGTRRWRGGRGRTPWRFGIVSTTWKKCEV